MKNKRRTYLKDLTHKQKDVFEYLLTNQKNFVYPPTLDELCTALGLNSRGSLYGV